MHILITPQLFVLHLASLLLKIGVKTHPPHVNYRHKQWPSALQQGHSRHPHSINHTLMQSKVKRCKLRPIIWSFRLYWLKPTLETISFTKKPDSQLPHTINLPLLSTQRKKTVKEQAAASFHLFNAAVALKWSQKLATVKSMEDIIKRSYKDFAKAVSEGRCFFLGGEQQLIRTAKHWSFHTDILFFHSKLNSL